MDANIFPLYIRLVSTKSDIKITMTTYNSTPKNQRFFARLKSKQTHLKISKMLFSPLQLEADKNDFNDVQKEKSRALLYFVKQAMLSMALFLGFYASAQQMLPESTTINTAFIPNISQYSNAIQYEGNTATITVLKLDGIKPGDKIRLYNEKRESYDAIVLCVRGDYFTIEGLPHNKFGEKVLVYGKEVHDFKTVDYDALSVMNYSAITKLTKQAEAQQNQNVTMRNEIAELHLAIDQMMLLIEEQNLQISSLKASALNSSEREQNETTAKESEIKGTRYIPNIYKKASSITYTENDAIITVDKLDDLRPGDKIKIYNEKNESYESEVATVNGNCFTIEKIQKELFGDNIFVYGKAISDLRSVGL